MKVLVVGGGGREHALVWRLAQDPSVTRVLAAPGNAGIAEVAECVPVAAEDLDGIAGLVEARDVDLTVIGPEVPLVVGLADVLRAAGRMVLGPSAVAARLEGSKAFAKDLLVRHGIPTARAGAFEEPEKAIAFVDELGGRVVVKADGLAAGKGVVVAEDRAHAVAAIEGCLGGAFGDAGRVVLVEEVLEGPEVSAFALCDGARVVPLALCQDFKRVGDDDAGPNTGGMGAYGPVPAVAAAEEAAIWDGIVRPASEAMAAEGMPFAGVLFAGVMLTGDGPKALEFNVRFGDPETQVLMPRLATEPGALFAACAAGDLRGADAAFRDESVVSVVLASGGYPGPYETGLPIEGLDDVARREGVTVFHAGTARDERGRIVTAGGRVLAVSALGTTLADARARAYEAADLIAFDGALRREDIAARAAKEEEEA